MKCFLLLLLPKNCAEEHWKSLHFQLEKEICVKIFLEENNALLEKNDDKIHHFHHNEKMKKDHSEKMKVEEI